MQLLKGWRISDGSLSLPEVNGSIKCPDVAGTWYAKAAAFAGLGGMIAVGYMDPGNWYVAKAIGLPSRCKYSVLQLSPMAMAM